MSSLYEEIKPILEKYSSESQKDNSDYALAKFLIRCIASFDIPAELNKYSYRQLFDMIEKAKSNNNDTFISQPAPGWICPRCYRVHAPVITRCPCAPGTDFGTRPRKPEPKPTIY